MILNKPSIQKNSKRFHEARDLKICPWLIGSNRKWKHFWEMVANKFKQQGTILFKKSWAATTYAFCFVKSSKMSFTQVVFSEENENLNSKTYQTIVSVRWYTMHVRQITADFGPLFLPLLNQIFLLRISRLTSKSQSTFYWGPPKETSQLCWQNTNKPRFHIFGHLSTRGQFWYTKADF